MPAEADLIYKSNDQIVAEVLASMQARIPDINVGPDSIFRIWTEVFANTVTGVYLAQQLLHDDMFIQTMSALALQRKGSEVGRPQKVGTLSTGTLLFSGAGGSYVAIGTVVGAPRAAEDDTLLFVTTAAGTIPNPGVPTAPTSAVGAAGALTGTYEWAVAFTTAAGETALGAASTALALTAQRGTLTAIPIGSTGTVARKLYRRVNGGLWQLVTTIADNTTTTYSDNAADGTLGGSPLTDSTAERISLAGQSDDTGTDYNVAIGAIDSLIDVSASPGLTGVTNTTAFAGATDIEDIEDFRMALLDYTQSPKSGAKTDLETWAEAVDGVDIATAFPNVNLAGVSTPGTVAIRIAGPNGTVPSGAIVTAVQAALDAKDLANITVVVGTFTANPVAVTVAITLATGYLLADVTPSVQAAITDYINSVPVGGTVYTAGIYKAIFGLPGIATVAVSAPSAPGATSTAVQKPTPGTLTVT